MAPICGQLGILLPALELRLARQEQALDELLDVTRKWRWKVCDEGESGTKVRTGQICN